MLANRGYKNCLAMVNKHLFPLLVFLKQLISLSSFLVIHFFFLVSKKTSTYIIFLKLKNIDYNNIALKTLNNLNLNNYSLGDPSWEINFGKSLKIAWSFCAKVFLRTSLCKNHTNWEMKIFNPPSNFACS